MLSQIASVFSSQGVVLPDNGYYAFPISGRRADGSHDPKEIHKAFAPVFDQASAKLELSKQAVKAAEEAARQKAAAKAADERRGGEAAVSGEAGEVDEESAAGEAEAPSKGPHELTPEEEKAVEKLKARDREVRQHEQAHIAASGGNARGGASYEYQVGPDKKQYAVGGHVNIDVSAVSGNPQATLQKAMAVQRAASAPAEPSGADRAVAAAAAAMARDAAKELAGKSGEKPQGDPEATAAAGSRSNPYARSESRTGMKFNALA